MPHRSSPRHSSPRRSSLAFTRTNFRNTLFLAAFAFTLSASAQSPGSVTPSQGRYDFASSITARADLPEAPQPQQAPAPTAEQAPAPTAEQAPVQPPAATPTTPATQATPATPAAQQPAQSKSQHDIAEEQLKQEKKQRMGILPNFNASYVDNAVPLTTGQKFRLMFSTEKDPATFGFSMFVALIGQAEGSHSAYGGGIGGYGKRFGQNYADTFDGAFWGNAVLPSILHQDPRYFRLGQGTAMHRIIYALSTNVRARHDGTNKWEPNYSNLFGNLISGGISNIYLPANERGVGSTFEGAFVVTAEGGVGSMLEEFWPDYIQYLHRRKARKQAERDAKQATPAATTPSPSAPQP